MRFSPKPIIFVICNLFLLALLFLSFQIYTSLFKNVPWHESCGMQFLVILIISAPGFIAMGVAFLVLSRSYPIRKTHKILPFAAAVLLTAPIFIDGGLSLPMQLFGAGTCIFLAILNTALTIENLVSYRKQQLIGS